MEEPGITHPVLAGAAPQTWAIDVLDDIVGGRPLLATRHPLGFVCLPVHRTEGVGVCLHVWGDEIAASRPTTSTVHSHSWDLDSYVLYGQLQNESIDLDDAPDDPTHRVFEIHSVGDVDEVRRTERLVRCRVRRSDHHRRGATYRLPAGVFHTTDVATEAATVAVGATRHETTDLSLGDPAMLTHFVPRQRCSRPETLHVARTLRDRLAGSGAHPRGDR